MTTLAKSPNKSFFELDLLKMTFKTLASQLRDFSFYLWIFLLKFGFSFESTLTWSKA